MGTEAKARDVRNGALLQKCWVCREKKLGGNRTRPALPGDRQQRRETQHTAGGLGLETGFRSA